MVDATPQGREIPFLVQVLFLCAFVLMTLFPALLSAQESLEATVRAALAEDPETVALPPEEFEALVRAIVEEAAAGGLTAEDLQEPVLDELVEGAESRSYDISFGGLSSGVKVGLSLLSFLIAFAVIYRIGKWLRAPLPNA